MSRQTAIQSCNSPSFQVISGSGEQATTKYHAMKQREAVGWVNCLPWLGHKLPAQSPLLSRIQRITRCSPHLDGHAVRGAVQQA